tara:strand:- start:654 stop:1226 length:573 start_codon:yes stop_codon:yes gene_type:complete
MNLPNHGKYEWLPLLNGIVKDFKPKKIIEFGPGRGQTTITMALALKELKINSKINSYDIWDENYWGEKDNCIKEFKNWSVDNFINLEHLDFYDWIKLPKKDREFDLLYFDIDNNGDKLLDLYKNVKHNIDNGSVVLFEGGSLERDNHGKLPGQVKKMNDVKNEIGYKVLTSNVKYSFSIIYNKNLYNLEY